MSSIKREASTLAGHDALCCTIQRLAYFTRIMNLAPHAAQAGASSPTD